MILAVEMVLYVVCLKWYQLECKAVSEVFGLTLKVLLLVSFMAVVILSPVHMSSRSLLNTLHRVPSQ